MPFTVTGSQPLNTNGRFSGDMFKISNEDMSFGRLLQRQGRAESLQRSVEALLVAHGGVIL